MPKLVICDGADRCREKIPGFDECAHSTPHQPIIVIGGRCDVHAETCSRLHGNFICVPVEDPECGNCEELW